MKSTLAFLVTAGLLWAVSGFTTKPENPMQCLDLNKNLVAKTSNNLPRTEFFSCTGPSVKLKFRLLDAVVEYQASADGGARITTIGIADSLTEAKAKHVKFGYQFISRGTAEYKKYQETLDQLLKKSRNKAPL